MAYRRTNSGLWVNRGLQGYWPLSANTINGNVALDVSGNGHHGTLINGPTLGPGPNGNSSLLFNGSNQYISGSGIQLTGSSITVIGRAFCISTPTEGEIFCLGSTPANGSSLQMSIVNTSNTRIGFWGDPGLVPSPNLLGVWADLGLTYDISSLAVLAYINGIQAVYSRTEPAPFNDTSTWNIGRFTTNANNFFNGYISAVRIYNRVLSPTEIYQIHASARPSFGLAQSRRLFVKGSSATSFFFTLNDTFSSSDLLAVIGLSSFSQSDSTASSDTYINYTLSLLTDSITSSDNTQGVGHASSAINDTSSSNDTNTSNALSTALLNDTSSSSDTAPGQGVSTGSLSDTTSGSDSPSSSMTSNSTLSDTAVTSDNLSAFLVSIILLSDTLSSADLFSIIASGLFTFNWSDTVSSLDLLSGVGKSTATLSDNSVTSDNLNGFMVATTLLSDSALTADLFTVIAAGSFFYNMSDGATSNDATSNTVQMVAAIFDTVASSDKLAGFASGRLSDTIASSDAISYIATLKALLQDSVASYDVISFNSGIRLIRPLVVAALLSPVSRMGSLSSVYRIGMA